LPSYGLIFSRSPNIGDDVQTLAARQYLPQVDYLVNRERISIADVPKGTKVIVNGWYMHQPAYWPPNENLHPLFISFHSKRIQPQNVPEAICDRLLTARPLPLVRKELHDYYLRCAPIYCRDEDTRRQFAELDIPAQYSGCLTLTLPRAEGKRSGIIFTDPFGVMPGTCFRPDHWLAMPKSLRKSSRITHLTMRQNVGKRLKIAEEILAAYACASLVVTSRLHAALPCIAMGTPVVFINLGFRDYRFAGYEKILRLNTLDDFMREARNGDIRSLACTPDEVHVAELACRMHTTCQKFINGD